MSRREAMRLLDEQYDKHNGCQTSAAIAAIEIALKSRDGFVLVPVLPTKEMVHAGGKARQNGRYTTAAATYQAMLLARPIFNE